jgi:hypothetical protein
MPAGEIHVNNIQTLFVFTIKDQDEQPVPITGPGAQVTIKFHPPTKPTFYRTGGLTTNGADGKVQYVTVDGDLIEQGQWSAQAFVEVGGGKWHSDIYKFHVYPNL